LLNGLEGEDAGLILGNYKLKDKEAEFLVSKIDSEGVCFLLTEDFRNKDIVEKHKSELINKLEGYDVSSALSHSIVSFSPEQKDVLLNKLDSSSALSFILHSKTLSTEDFNKASEN
jgi:hypothetical protein